MKQRPLSILPGNDEQGFILVVAILLLVILSILGIAATNTSMVEVQIAGNDRLQKQAFSEADGGTQAGAVLLEENIACPNGFSGSAPMQIGGMEITDDIFGGAAKLNFWVNETVPAVDYPTDAIRYVRLPNDDTVPHTNLYFASNSSLTTGNAIQMIAGYEGTGYSAASGGGQLVTNIDSQHLGLDNSVSVVRAQWRHIVGKEGKCRY
jgi:hypothetical protein